MRQWWVVFLALALGAGTRPALAETNGHQARFTIQMELGEEFYQALGAAGDEDRADIQPVRLEPVTGQLYFTDTRLRMDMAAGKAGAQISTIIDRRAEVMLLVNHQSRVCWRADLTLLAEQYRQSGLPLLNPEQVFAHWEEVQEQLQSLPGVKHKDLGARQVNARSCHGLGFSGRIEELLKADSVALMPQLGWLREAQGQWRGEFWLDAETGVPMSMSEELLGARFTWEVLDLKPAELSEVLFMIPRGYAVKDMELGELETFSS